MKDGTTFLEMPEVLNVLPVGDRTRLPSKAGAIFGAWEAVRWMPPEPPTLCSQRIDLLFHPDLGRQTWACDFYGLWIGQSLSI